MIQVFTTVGALLAGVLALMLASGLFGTFLSVRATLEGFGETQAGLLMSGYYAGLVVGTQLCGRLINRIGHIRAFAAFCAVSGAAVCLFPFAINVWVWMGLRGVIGFVTAGMFMVAESWLNAKTNATTRGTAFSLYMMVSYLGVSGGQMLINVGSPTGSDLFLITIMLYCAALIPVAVGSVSAPEPVDSTHLSFRRLYEISPLSVIGCMASGLLTGAVYGLGPIFGRNLGLNVQDISVMMTVLVIGGFLMQFPVGRLSDRFDRRWILTLATFGGAIASAAIVGLMLWHTALDSGDMHPPIGFWAEFGPWLLALIGIYGGLAATLYPLSVAYANDYIEAQDMVAASAGLVLAYGCGAAAGPVVAGLAMRAIGPSGLFAFTTAVLIATVVFALYRMRRRHWVPVMEKEAFQVLPGAGVTPTATELDPRTHDAQMELEF